MKTLLLLLLLLLIFPTQQSVLAAGGNAIADLRKRDQGHILPLYTLSRWIVDSDGRRVKLACANWAAHLEPAAAEGLAAQPLDFVSRIVSSMGFNCVRLTWPLYLLTRPSLADLTLRESLSALRLHGSVAGVAINNPDLLDLTVVQAFQAVVSNLARNNIMVILDNQISKPGWCCSRLDGNGFFGDRYFDPDEWLEGLRKMAKLFNGSNDVVGMSLRNELRGPNQTLGNWYKFMQRGAEAIHSENPDVLVILSGLDYDKNLSFLNDKQVELSFTKKLVFELHWYGFSDGEDWANENPNRACARSSRNFMTKGGFLLEQGWPLFISEFGGDLRGNNVPDNRFLSCFFGVAAELDLDWAIWALQGSYYIRDGRPNYDETYGVLSRDWSKARNPGFVRSLNALQLPFQGPQCPSDIQPYQILFHPLTGQCVRMSPASGKLEVGPCAQSDAWNYTSEHRIMLEGTVSCFRAVGAGKAPALGTGCLGSSSQWDLVSESKLHVASKLDDAGIEVCLDVRPDGEIVTNPCTCLRDGGVEDADDDSGDDDTDEDDINRACNPESQWFKFITSNNIGATNSVDDDETKRVFDMVASVADVETERLSNI